MLSTTQTLTCPSCGQSATVRIHTLRSRPGTVRDGFEPQLFFWCRGRCVLTPDAIRTLCGIEPVESHA